MDYKRYCSNCSNITAINFIQNVIEYSSIRLSPYIDEMIGDRQCGFQRYRLNTDQNFCICQILDKNWEHSECVHKLFIDFS
jgi:hypothetical protein